MALTTKFRACPLCESICGLEFQYDDGRLTGIRGDAADPFSHGHLCPKGNAILDLESDPDRVRRPLRRRGEKFEEISWEEAFAFAGERLAAIQKAHGADAVAVYLGNPTAHHFGHIAYVPAFLRLLRSRNTFSASSVDQWPHQFVAWLMFGHQFLLPIPDVDRTDYFLMLGANPVASNGSLMTAPGIARRLEALAQRGGRLVVVDPRRTETARVAAEHVFIRPGTDALFLIGLLQALPEFGPARLERYGAQMQGWSEALTALASFDPGLISARTGVSPETIHRIAGELYRASRACVYGRVGLSTQSFGSVCQWLIQLLNIYTGNLDAEGGALPNEAALPLTGPGTPAGHYGKWQSRVRGLPEFAGELPVAVLAEEILTPGPGQVRALVTVAGNPVLSTPAGHVLEGAIASLEFRLAIDIYVNETTRLADLILPPASSLTQDHYDLIFNAFAVRRVARLNVPLAEREPEERGDWEIFNGLAAAFAQAAEKPFTPLPPPRKMLALGLARGASGVTVEDLLAAPHGLDLGPLHPSLLARLQTESRAIECAPPVLLADLARLARETAAPDEVGTLRLIGRRHVRSNNSWMHNSPRLVKGAPRHQLLMHAGDLSARGLAEGESVRVVSRVGAITVPVKASDEMMPGVVCLPHGYGHVRPGVRLAQAGQLAGESYNDLSDPLALDGPTGNAALSGLAVRVEKVPTE